MKFISTIRNGLKLPTRSKILFVEALLNSLRNEIHLRNKTTKQLRSLLEKETVSLPKSDKESEIVYYTAGAITAIKKYAPWRPKCFNTALTARQMLAKRNIHSRLHIGFRKKEGKLQGHAWLTYNGEVITGHKRKLHEYQLLSEHDHIKIQESI